MPITFKPLPTSTVHGLQSGDLDAYGHVAERKISDGDGVPCRHCLQYIEKDEAYLVLAHRPFESLQPYAETGPIFLHADTCKASGTTENPPEILDSPDYILRGYGKDERIVYGTGAVTPTADIASYANELLSRKDIEFVHVRSARNNCFQCRIERA